MQKLKKLMFPNIHKTKHNLAKIRHNQNQVKVDLTVNLSPKVADKNITSFSRNKIYDPVQEDIYIYIYI